MLGWAVLNYADLGGANLRGADLSKAMLDQAELDCADLSGTTLVRANLMWAQLPEAAQQKHALLADRVDHLADFLVVKEEVDELRDLKVIDCDRWLAFGSNDQALLLGSFAKLHAPCGDAVDAAVGERCIYEIGANQLRPIEVRPLEVRAVEERPAEVRPLEVRPAEVGLV
jgi:Pentapeptide repeats (8 copies)